MFGKNNYSGFLGKGVNFKLIGAGKGLQSIENEPMKYVSATMNIKDKEDTLGYHKVGNPKLINPKLLNDPLLNLNKPKNSLEKNVVVNPLHHSYRTLL